MDWHRFYPLQVGTVWEYEEAHRGTYSPLEIVAFHRRTIVGDTTLGGAAYRLVHAETFAQDYSPLGAALCAVRLEEETGQAEWLPLDGECDAPEAEPGLDLRAGAAAPSHLFVGNVPTTLDAVRTWSLGEDPPDEYEFGADLGLIQWERDGGIFGEQAIWRVIYAEVGGETYGRPFDSEAWKGYYPLNEGDVREYRHRYDYGNGPTYTAYYRWTVGGDTTIGGQTYRRVELQRYHEHVDSGEIEPAGEGTCGVRFVEATGGVERLDISGPCATVGTSWIVDLRATWSVRAGELFGEPTVEKWFGYVVPMANGESEAFAYGIGLIARDSWQSGSGGGSWSETRLLYAVVDGVSYGTPSIPTANEGTAAAAPTELTLGAPYPNPFDVAVTLPLNLPTSGEPVSLEVFDVLGRRVLRSELGLQPAGATSHRLDLSGLPVGSYFVRAITTSAETRVQRVTKVE